MTCARCRKVSRSRAKFCSECGAKLTPGARPTQDVAAAPVGQVEPVLGAIARTAARLCEASDALIYLVEDDRRHLVAKYGAVPVLLTVGDSLPISSADMAGCAILQRRTIHVRDMRAAARTRFPGTAALQQRSRTRTTVAAPLLLGGVAVGVIVIRRTRVRPFTVKQIALLKTFADQAAIAIANARLSAELAGRNHELGEALERQTTTAEILRVIATSPTDNQPVLDAVVESAARLCRAYDAAVFRLEGDVLRLVAHHGPLRPAHGLTIPVRGTVGGRSVIEARPVQVPDLQAASAEFPVGAATARELGVRTTLSVPLLRDGVAIGAIQLPRAEVAPFTDGQIALLRTFADQAVIAIDNARLFEELQARNAELTEALAQQTATGEILGIISRSPTDIQPVLDTMVESAARLCEAFDVSIFQLDGDRLRLVAHRGPIPAVATLPLVRGRPVSRSVLDARTIHIADVQVEAAEFPQSSEVARREGWRTILSVPLMRGGVAMGAVTLRRAEAHLFTERQIALLETFADQAVIAIENVRLFTELEARNAELTEALAQQTATGEILGIISRSPTDIQPVLDTMAESAARLCEALRRFHLPA